MDFVRIFGIYLKSHSLSENIFEEILDNRLQDHNLAKSISDAGWGEFISMLVYKAESAGRTVEKVPLYGTTQECSRFCAAGMAVKYLGNWVAWGSTMNQEAP